MLLSVALSVRHLSKSQNSSRLLYCVSLNEALSLSVGLLHCLPRLSSLSEDGALCTKILRKKFWIISVKRTYLDVNLKIATFWLIWNIASEVNSKLLQLNISRFFPRNCNMTIIFLQSRSGSLWCSDRKQKCVINNYITGIESSNLGYKWQLYQALYENNYAIEKVAKKYKEPCQITAMTQISIQNIF